MTGVARRRGAAPGLRMARRDGIRHPVRSTLIVLLIALPVTTGVAGDLLLRAAQLSPAERVERVLGRADALVELVADPQSPLAMSTVPPPQLPDRDAVLAALPAGARILPYQGDASVSVRTRAGSAQISLDGLDYAAPLAAGIVHQRSGRPPRTVDEVAISPALATATGLRLGQVLQVRAPEQRDLTVVGVAFRPSDTAGRYALTLPDALPGLRPGHLGYLVAAPDRLAPADADALSGMGLLVTQRREWLAHPQFSHVDRALALRVAAVGGLLAVGVVLLLAGAAFSMGARRQRHELALLAAAGASPRQLRWPVLGAGLVAGVAGAVTGTVLGVGGAVAARPFVENRSGELFGAWQLHPIELAAILLLTVATAVAAAVRPARAAARVPLRAALTRAEPLDAGTRRARPWLSASVFLVGMVLAWKGAGITAWPGLVMIVGGVLCTVVALIALAPAGLPLLGRAGHRLALPGRLALRSLTRHRGRTSSATAAVTGAVCVAVALSIGIASRDAADRERYNNPPYMLPGQVLLSSVSGTPITPAAVAAVARQLPAVDAAEIQNVETCEPGGPQCPLYRLVTASDLQGARPECHEEACYHSAELAVGDATAVAAFLGHSAPGAAAALRAGQAVVLDPALVVGGTAMLGAYVKSYACDETGCADPPPPQLVATLPAFVPELPASALPSFRPGAVISAETEQRLRLSARLFPTGIISTSRMPTNKEEQAARNALLDISPGYLLTLERGYHSRAGLVVTVTLALAALLVVATVLLTTALTLAESGAEISVLTAVGAAPRLQRVLAAHHAGVITALGSAVGLVAAGLPVTAIVAGEPGLSLAVPWAALGGLLLAAPALAAAGAYLFARPRTR